MKASILRTCLVALVTMSTGFLYFSCGSDEEFNVFQPIAEPLALTGDRAAMLEEAKTRMDEGDYEGAEEVLDDMIGKDNLDSNDVRLLYAAAQLGIAKLDVWSIIKNFLDSQDDDQRTEGVNQFFDSFTETFLGDAAERSRKTSALSSSITALQEAPQPEESDVKTTACLLAGLLAVPTLADAQEALDDVQQSLNQIRTAAQSGGSECPNLDSLDDATASMLSATRSFSLVLDAAGGCSFLDLSETESVMNTVQTQLSQLVSTADQGCSALPSCPAAVPDCQSLFPACVQESLDIGPGNDAQAGDGQIAACELILNCTDSLACFGQVP